MSRPSRCIPSEALKELSKLYESFTGPGSKASKYFHAPKSEFRRFLEMDMGVDIDTIEYMARAGNYSKGDVKSLSDKLDNVISSLETGKLKGIGWLYVPASFAKIDPTINQVLKDYQAAGHHTQARGLKDARDVQKLYDLLRLESEFRANNDSPGKFDKIINKYIKRPLGRTPQQKLNKLTKLKRMAIAEAKAGKPGAASNLVKLTRMQDELIKDTNLNVHNDLLDIIENKLPSVIAAENRIRTEKSSGKTKIPPEEQQILNVTIASDNKSFSKRRKDMKGNVVKVDLMKDIIGNIKTEDGKKLNHHMSQALVTYIKLMDRAHTTLVNAIKAKIDMLTIKSDKNLSKEDINLFKKNLEEKLIPDYEAGFFPHYVEDLTADFWGGIMPLFDDLNIASNPYIKKAHGDVTIRGALNNINTYISGHAKKRETSRKKYKYSPNFMLSVNDYLSDVNKFNFISHIDKYQAQALRSVETSFKKTEGQLNGYARRITEFIMDMHNTAVGRGDINNPHLRGVQRTLLGFEFGSKMGLNIRSIAKNATQYLINYISWNRAISQESSRWWDGDGRAELAVGYGEHSKAAIVDIDKVLENLGIGFSKGMSPELMESGLGRTETKVAIFDENGKIKFREPSKMEDIAGVVSNIGSALTGGHRWVENKNRAGTFKVGYYQMWKWLDVPEFYEKFESTTKAKNEIHRRAEQYALNMTIGHHFDYNDFSKSRILTKAGGKLAGQFQHFAFSFYELTNNIFRRGKNDIMSREVTGHNAMKIYRYSTIYFLAPLLGMMSTGVDLTRVLDNPYVALLTNWYDWLFGTEEEKKEAFYGRGPVMGTIGAPALGTILKAGEAAEFINLREDSLLGIMAGYREPATNTGDEELLKKIRIGNIAAGRAMSRTIPAMSRGDLGWALQSELGLFATKEARDIQEKYGYRIPTKSEQKSKKKQIVDPATQARQNLIASLNTIQRKPRSNRYDKFQKQNLMNAFEMIRKQQREESDIYTFDNNRKMTIS